jgi:hypothetical protein
MNKQTQQMTAETTPTWVYIAVTIACVCFLAIGFFFAARQHFMAMDLGIKNSKLRKQLEEMEGENRRLVLAREVVRSPLEMKRIAARRGLRNADEVFGPVAASVSSTKSSPLVQRTSLNSPASKSDKPLKAFYGAGAAPKVSKTVSRNLIASAGAN